MNGGGPTLSPGNAAPGAARSPATLIGVVVIGVLVAAGALYWYSVRLPSLPAPSPAAQPPAGEAIGEADLGTEIYKQAANPVAEQLPTTVAPVPNPLEETYKNPFE
jgi:hypothetical protein